MSLKIEKKHDDAFDTVTLVGRLDTMTAPELESFISNELSGDENLVLDLEGLEYISSAGLRVILKLQKLKNKSGSLKLVHVGEIVMEVLEITGFTDILTIE